MGWNEKGSVGGRMNLHCEMLQQLYAYDILAHLKYKLNILFAVVYDVAL